MIICYFDGACEPKNPGGHASYGFVVSDPTGKRLGVGCGYIGVGPEMSNNVAEYQALNETLKFLIQQELTQERIIVRGDSMLAVNQMAGLWEVRSPNGLYVPYYEDAKELVTKFRRIQFEWIPREKNGEADMLSKKALTERGVKITVRK